MKSRVVFMALLCLLFIFTGAMAEPDHPKVLNPTYNGQAQALFANPDRQTWVYYFNGAWGETVPTATDAGSYEFQCSLKGDSPAKTCTGTIAKATLTITPNTNVRSKTYGDPDPAMQYSVSGLASGERIVTGNNFLSRVEGENKGTYDFILGKIYDSTDASNKFKTANYNTPALADGIQFEIKAATAELVWSDLELTYNGQEQGPKVEIKGLPEDAVCTVILENGSKKDAGTYTAKATNLSGAGCTNYALPEDETLLTKEWTIKPFETTVEWSDQGPFTYSSSNPKKPTATYKNYTGTDSEAIVTITDSTGAISDGKNVGTYTATAEPKSGNHKFTNSNTLEYSVIKHKLTIKPTEGLKKEFNGVEPNFTYDIFNENNSKVTDSVKSHLTSSELKRETGESVGKYDYSIESITLEENYGKNYELVLDDSIQFEITKASNGIVTYAKVLEPTYNGTEQTLIEAAIPKGGTVMYFLQGETPSSELPTGKNAGDYDIYYYVAGGDSYEDFRSADSPNGPIKAKIKKAAITVTPDEGQTKKSGDPEPVLTYKVTDSEGNPVDVKFDGSLARSNNNEAVGKYNIEQGTLALPEADKDNYDLTFKKGVRFEILPADITEYTEPTAAEGLVYDGEEKTLITAGQTENGIFMYFLEGSPTAYEYLPTAIKAGDYKVFYYIQGTGNYGDKGSIEEPLGSVTTTIAKATLTIVPIDPLSKKYGENDPETFNYQVKLGEADMTTKAKQNISGNLTRAEGETVGKYPFSVEKLVMNDAYKANFEKLELAEDAAEFEITLGDNERTGYSEVLDLTYNGQPQTLITEATAKGGTVMYFIEGETPSSELPKATNAGKYNIYYYVIGDDKYGDLASQAAPFGPIAAEIKKLAVTVVPDAKSKVYGDEDPELTYTFDPASPVPGVTGNIGRNAGEDVGDYYFNRGDLALDKTSEGNFVLSFKDNDKDHLFSITKAAEAKVTAPVAKTGLVYNGKPQDLLEILASVEGDKTAVIVYQIGSATTQSNPNAKNAGDYEIEYFIKGDDNHKELRDPSWKLTASIAKAPLTAVPNENQKKAYGDSDPDVYLFHFDGLVNGEENNDAKWSGAIIRDEGKDAGFYGYKQGTLKLADDSNYTLTFDDQGVKFEITKVAPVITKNPAVIPNLVYTGEPKAIITAGEVEGGTMMYFVDGDEPSEKVPEKTNAGTYNVYFYVIGDENHNDLDDTNHHYDVVMNAAIAKAKVTVKPTEGQGKEYGAAEPAELTYTWTPETPKPEFTGALQRDAIEGVGDCYIRQGTLDLTDASKVNFEMIFQEGVFSITKAKAKLKNEPIGKTGLEYNGTYQGLLATLASTDDGTVHYVLDGHDVTDNPSAVPAGDYTVYYYIAGDNNHSDNGSAAEPLGSVDVSIAKATVTLKPNAAEKVVGTDDPSLGWSSSGWKGNDESKDRFTGKLSREEGESIGQYAITQGTLTLNDAMTVNYNLKFVDGVLFTITPSQEVIEVTINGNTERQGYTGNLITMEHPFVLDEDTQKGILESDITCTGKVTGTDKGTYTAYLNELGCTIKSTSYPKATLNVPDDAVATLIISEATITEADFIAPTVREGLVFNGNDQNLINPGKWTGMEKGTFVYSITDYTQKAVTVPTTESQEIPQGFDAGNYTVTWKIIGNGNFSDYNPADPELDAEIAQLDLESDEYPVNISIEPAIAPYTEEPNTAVVTITVNGMQLQENRDYEIVNPDALTQTEIGIYTVLIDGVNPNVTGSASVTWEIKDMVNRINMFRVGEPDKVCLRCGVLGGELPATGFPTRVNVPLAVKPQGLDYAELGMRIQIPSLNVDVELAGVPTMDGAWKVEWLADRAGLLSGTALPGDGYSIVAAHNTLNAEEVGPFVLLSTLQDNDTIFVNAPDGSMKLFRVYANELLAPNDMETLASIAEQESNTLVLVTCENESVDGGYLNRRVVFAKPLN